MSRLERELERERLQGKSKTSTLQRRLDEALQQGQSATREHETSRMALAAAQMAHDQQLRDADKKQTALRHDLSSAQVCWPPLQPPLCFLGLPLEHAVVPKTWRCDICVWGSWS